jgi:all-trans-retinol 13,14-reductase
LPTRDSSHFDAIVIGSGMGGMTVAAALSRFEHRVLLLEQAPAIGGLTHTFSRNGFSWDVGLHYCGLFGHTQKGGRILDWLTDRSVEFQSIGTVYDTLHFPDGFDVAVGRPVEAYKAELREHFPGSAAEIDAYFAAVQAAYDASSTFGAQRAIPRPAAGDDPQVPNDELARWYGRTTSEVISELVSDPKLAAVLAGQWGTYGGRPSEASFGMHAIIMAHYLDGAGYPVGGGAAITKGLVPVIEAAGGHARAATSVSEILIEGGKAVGVRTDSGEEFRAPTIVSAIGAHETVAHLLPPEWRGGAWAAEVSTFRPAVCHFELYLGFEGDIARYGATRGNHWFVESWDMDDGIWCPPDAPISRAFASFPSLKDPTHDPGPSQCHTGECMVLADWSSVAAFADGGAKARPAEWKAFKQRVEADILAFYEAKFPALAPMIVYRELGTPLATVSFTGHERGGFYGVEPTPRRMLSDSLRSSTPIPGLFMAGQDVMTPGIAGALFGGMLCAAAIEPRAFEPLLGA